MTTNSQKTKKPTTRLENYTLKQKNRYKILIVSSVATAIVLLAKVLLHYMGVEFLAFSSLHSAVVTGTFFVIGFLLSATIADYKESERIPSEFSSVVENMYEDGKSIGKVYPGFDIQAYRKQLRKVVKSFGTEVRSKKHSARVEIYKINDHFVAMEHAGVPPNFITKLKQQQAQLLRVLFRVTYIQRITFIPSASILVHSIVPLTIIMLLLTKFESGYAGFAVVGIISFIMIFILRLIHIISTPFHSSGRTQDDVSLFLIDETTKHLS